MSERAGEPVSSPPGPDVAAGPDRPASPAAVGSDEPVGSPGVAPPVGSPGLALPVGPADRAEPPLLSDGALLGLLVFDAVLLAMLGLAFAPLYLFGVSAPVSALLTVLALPWLVRRAGEIGAGRAAAPLAAWALTTGLLGLAGPGGDLLLPSTWPTLLLLFGGLGAGLLALRSASGRAPARDPLDR